MDQGEFEALLHRIDQLIRKSEPRKAEYWRGYREGVRFQFQGKTGETVHAHYHLHEIADRNYGDPYLEAYARGYRDGCEGETLCLVLPDEEEPRDPEAR
jgi:hypothetical protein